MYLRSVVILYFLLSYSASAQILNKVFPLGSIVQNHPNQPTAFPLKQGKNLYGVASCITNEFVGCLFKITPASPTPEEACYFRYSDGAPPYGQLVLGSDGCLIGTASSGGDHGSGTLFAYNQTSGNLTVLHHFTGADGTGPQGKLVQAGDWIYGTTSTGGNNGLGVLFRIWFDGTDFEVLHHFSSDLSSPSGDLVALSNGGIVGVCLRGGNADLGGIWKAAAPATIPTFIHEYTTDGGYGNYASIFLSGDGFLYCTAESGGSLNRGVLFRLNPETGERTEIWNFPDSNGPSQPIGPVTEDSHGRLLGITRWGAPVTNGAFYCIEKDGNNFETRGSFTSPYGAQTAKGLQQSLDGTIYTTVSAGGPLKGGCILEVSSDASAFDEIASFRGSLADASRVSYISPKPGGGWLGLSSNGGIANSGTLIEFTTELNDRKVLVDFGRDGCSTPSGPLLLGSDGKYYGVLQYGGPNGKGALYRLLADLSGYEIIHAFGPDNEQYPFGKLFEISPGTLAGTCGTPGVIFKVDVTGQNYGVIKTFSNSAEGSGPVLLHYDAAKHQLTGICIIGGTQDAGVVFQLSADGSNYQKLHDFQESDGTRPNASAYLSESGLLYGTTLFGGADNAGTVFSINPETGSVALVGHLATTGMAQPTGIFCSDQLGYLYGGAVYGGLAGEGGIFRMKTNGQNASNILSDTDGQYVYSVQNMISKGDDLVVGSFFKGSSSPGGLFAIALQPKLRLQMVESTANLQWLEIGRPYTLEATSSLTESWTSFEASVNTISATNSVSAETGANALFFRLKANSLNR